MTVTGTYTQFDPIAGGTYEMAVNAGRALVGNGRQC